MKEKTRQRVWLSAVLVLGVFASVQYLNNRDLRSELERTREEFQERVDRRARTLMVETVREQRQDMIDAGQWLHAFYQSEEGLQRKEGLWIDGHPDFDGLGSWLFGMYLPERLAGTDDAAARQKVADTIRQSDEWRQKHPDSR